MFALGTSFSSHMISSSLEIIHSNPSMAGLRLAVQTEEKRARLRLHIAPVVAVRPLHVFIGLVAKLLRQIGLQFHRHGVGHEDDLQKNLISPDLSSI